VVLLLQLNLNLFPHRLDLPPLSFSVADQIAKEKPLQDWNQQALRSCEFKLKSGINRILPTGCPPIYSALSLSSPPLRAER
jgi:hypothetical protein